MGKQISSMNSLAVLLVSEYGNQFHLMSDKPGRTTADGRRWHSPAR
jgi:hypothetical protein